MVAVIHSHVSPTINLLFYESVKYESVKRIRRINFLKSGFSDWGHEDSASNCLNNRLTCLECMRRSVGVHGLSFTIRFLRRENDQVTEKLGNLYGLYRFNDCRFDRKLPKLNSGSKYCWNTDYQATKSTSRTK